MFISTIERNNELYEIKDYDLNALQTEENIGKVIAVGVEGFVVADMPVLEEKEAVAKVNGVKYTTLQEAFDAVEGSAEVKLLDNIVLNAMVIVKVDTDVVLNLNNYTISVADGVKIAGCLLAVPNGSSLTIDGHGKIYAVAPNGSNDVYGAIQVTLKEAYDETKVAKLVINNGEISSYYYGIVGNGSRENSEVIVNGGKIIAVASTGLGIFNPQPNSKVTINGGFITAATGIEMRAGDLVVNRGVIESITAPTTVNPNGSGSTTVGSAIAICQHTTKKPINATINAGFIKGYHALHQSNPQNNEEEAIALVNMEVNGGTMIAINGGSMPVYSENKEGFVNKGTFVPAIDEKYMA